MVPPGIAVTGLVLLAALPSPAAAQVAPVRSPWRAGERVTVGEDIGRYRALYGEPEFRTLDDEGSRPWPRLKNIRTVGSFAAIPGKGGSGSAPLHLGRLEYDSKYTTHMICGRTYCLALMAVPELRDFFFQTARSWQYQDVEVIGAIDNVAKPTPYNQEPPTYAFQVWSISLATGGTTRRGPREGPTLESLVRGPEAAAGRAITVSGVFRGSNLFGDLPDESRRQPSDWVLQDGPFSVWVTGREPKGGGWALDPRSKTDCSFRLEVRGRVQTAGGFVYLRAKDVTLLGRVRPDTEPASDGKSR
jgi:hypothetical protein